MWWRADHFQPAEPGVGAGFTGCGHASYRGLGRPSSASQIRFSGNQGEGGCETLQAVLGYAFVTETLDTYVDLGPNQTGEVAEVIGQDTKI